MMVLGRWKGVGIGADVVLGWGEKLVSAAQKKQIFIMYTIIVIKCR